MIKAIKKRLLNWFIDQDYHSPLTADLTGKVVVITGASRGIGQAIAVALQNEGASLALISRDISGSKPVFKDNKNVLLINANITGEKEVDEAVKTIMNKFGRIDVLVNNAGVNSHKPLEKTSLPEFQSVFNLNVTGVFLMCKEIIPILKRQKTGLIINIGSKISHNPNVGPNKVVYATSKYALEGFSLALGKELQSFGIRVSCLMPGTVNTFISKKSKQFLSPFDVASVILMLIKFKDINFESVIFKSLKQNI